MQVKVNNSKQLGVLIRAVRKQEKIRQDDIADMIERSHIYVGDVEAGKPQPNIGGILDLLDELGIQLILDVPLNSDAVEQAFKKLEEYKERK